MTAGGEQYLPASFAHLQAMPVPEEDPAFAATFTKFSDVARDHKWRSGGRARTCWDLSFHKLLDGFTQHQSFCSDVQARVVIGGLDPFNIVYVDERIPGSVRHYQSPGVVGIACASPSLRAAKADFSCSWVTNAACETICSLTRRSAAFSRSASTGLVR